jgi:hypothetical protein
MLKRLLGGSNRLAAAMGRECKHTQCKSSLHCSKNTNLCCTIV